MSLPFTQTKEYLSWHNAVGTKTFFLEFFRDISESENFQIDSESQKELYAVCACVVLNLRIGKVLYVPYGPVLFANPADDELEKVNEKLKEVAQNEGCVFVRTENTLKGFKPPVKTYSHEGIFQPRMEWWLDITESEEELMNRIHKDHRYSIRRAQKELIEVITVKENLEKYFEEFWNLLKETGERDGFQLYDRKYYEQIFKSGHELKKFLVFTKLNDKFMSVALIVISDHVANLVFAGSKGENRELGFNHLMQWAAIRESKKHACRIYNFGGITEKGYGKEGLKGVTSFKRKFGGYVKFHGDFIDIPISKLKYFLYILRKMI